MIILNNFLNYMKALKKSPNTISSYALDLKLWMKFQFPGIDEITIDDLQNVQLQQFYDYLAAISHKASSTQARNISSIKMLYVYLKEFKLIENNPSEVLHQPQITNKLPRYMNENQCVDLLDSVEWSDGQFPERDYAIITVFLNTGIRESELINIKLADINEDNILTVVGKGDKEREIPLNESCLESIADYMKVRPDSTDNHLFLTRTGTKFSRHGIMRIGRKYFQLSGNEKLSIHKLRHTAATMWLRNGADITKIKEILGHNSILTTMKYAHVTNDDKKNVMANTPIANIKRKSNKIEENS
jgi:integrase/recombinase XerD